MKIDAHQFFWKYQTGQFNHKPQGQYDVLKNDYLPHDLLVSLVNNNIEGSIAVQNSKSDHETKYLLELSEMNEFVRGVIGWIDLEDPNIGQKINFYKNTKLVSFRESFNQKEDSYFALRSNVVRGIELIQEYKFPLDIQCRADQFPAVIDLISQLPDQIFVLNDMGFMPHSADSMASWKGLIAAVAPFTNTYCKINGLFMLRKLIQMDWMAIKECFLYLEKVFGAERIIFGSDWPYSNVLFDYQEQIRWVEETYESLSDKEIEHIFGLTAEKVYFK